MMSIKTLLADPKRLLAAIILCLNQLLSEHHNTSHSPSMFDLKSPPTISVADYLARNYFSDLGMYNYMKCSPSVFINAVVLIDRVQENNPDLTVHPRNVHRLLLAANLVSAKYLDDLYFKNTFYANVGGVSLKVLNDLETELMKLLDFNAHVDLETMEAYASRLEHFLTVSERS